MSTEKKKEQQLLEDVTAQHAVQSSYSTAGLNSRKEVENAPARAAGIWTNTAAVWRWRVSAFWSRRAAAHRAPPPCWALMMNAGLSCAMTVKAALLP